MENQKIELTTATDRTILGIKQLLIKIEELEKLGQQLDIKLKELEDIFN
jgi:hypothetical protein